MTNQNETLLVTVKDLAQELFINAKSLRKKIRDNKIPKPGTRWEWPDNHPDVKVIRSWKDQPVKPKKEAKAEVKEVIKEEEAPKVITVDAIVYQKGNWTIIKSPQGVKATYITDKSQDSTPWYTEESQIRKTLPAYLKEEIKKALQ